MTRAYKCLGRWLQKFSVKFPLIWFSVFPTGFGITTKFWDRPFQTLIPEETFEKED